MALIRKTAVTRRTVVDAVQLERLANARLTPDWDPHEIDRTIRIHPPAGQDPVVWATAIEATITTLVEDLIAAGWDAQAIPPYFPSIPFWQVAVQPP